jgi:AbiV family abortive infection protein
MKKARNYHLTTELLSEYSAAALKNAAELLEEATLLEAHGHAARAYFLAIASIEETGKAIQAFQAQGRNLSDSAVSLRLKRSFEDHSQKITAAFIPWLSTSSNVRETAEAAAALTIDLKFGREPSMYTDISPDGATVQTPTSLVRRLAGSECVRLARDCLTHTIAHFERHAPPRTTRAQDKLFAMKPALLQRIMNTHHFWEFYISRMEAGDRSYEDAVIQYNDNYFSKGVSLTLEGSSGT